MAYEMVAVRCVLTQEPMCNAARKHIKKRQQWQALAGVLCGCLASLTDARQSHSYCITLAIEVAT